MKKVIIVGGGASGMMAAIQGAKSGCKVLLLEKTGQLGSKLLLTGDGRCNLTNSGDIETFIKSYGMNGRFFYNCFSQFFNKDLVKFFESRGVKTVKETGGRIFPKSGNADNVLKCLSGCLKESGVEVKTGFKVDRILVFENRITGVHGNSAMIPADAIIIATGGMSYSFTGSSGDGYKMAQELGHKIVPPKPHLVPLVMKETFVKEIQGVSLKEVEITGFVNTKRFIQITGDMLFTHFGISGPAVLNISREVGLRLGDGVVTVSINLRPGATKQKLEGEILKDLKEHHKLRYKNLLRRMLPNSMADLFLNLSRVSEAKRCCDVTKEERQYLIDLLFDFKLTIKGTRPIEEAMVTDGGVALEEIIPKTMESKLIRGLFFCGEVIDAAGDTGGYNLQAAFSTGYVAGRNAGIV